MERQLEKHEKTLSSHTTSLKEQNEKTSELEKEVKGLKGALEIARDDVKRLLEDNKAFWRLLATYNPLRLSPQNNSMGIRKKKTLKRHRENVVKNWERCELRPIDEVNE